MEFCGMKREIDRKCLIYARVHANAQSFDRCEVSPCLGAEQKARGLWELDCFNSRGNFKVSNGLEIDQIQIKFATGSNCGKISE